MRTIMLCLTALWLLSTTGCIKDTLYTTYTYTMATPVYKTSNEVRQAIKNLAAEPVINPGKMYLYGSYIFLNEKGKGIHIIDNSNPVNPINEAFVNIPGCEDLAVSGNTLYADCYTDLMVIDISNPKSVTLKKFIHNLFPDRQYIMGYRVDSNKVIADWIVKDTTVTQKMHFSGSGWIGGGIWFDSRAEFSTAFMSNSGAQKSAGGKGGSMARFAISQNHLYTVTHNKLHALSLQQPQDPLWKSTTDLGWGIETIYPFKDKLFIGANSGMHIYTVTNASQPQHAGTFQHARVCDPVIADDNYAYVTLRSGTMCQGFINQLDVVNVSNIFSPKLIKSYPLTNPHGLDKNGSYLYVCDGESGVKVLNAANVNNVILYKTINIKNAYDIICWNNVAIISAIDGMHQYDISNVDNIKPLSFIGLKK